MSLFTFLDLVVEFLPDDVHKIPPYIQFQHIAGASPVIRAGTQMMLKTPHAVKRSHAFATRVTVRNEGAFKNRGSVVV